MLNGMIFFTVSAATIFSWALTLEGVTTAIAGIGREPRRAARSCRRVIVITVLMGAVLESFVTIVILAPLLLPVAQQLGINPLQYGIVMTEAFGIGSILPPIGIALYVACAIMRRAGREREQAAALVPGRDVRRAAAGGVTCPGSRPCCPTLLNFKG